MTSLGFELGMVVLTRHEGMGVFAKVPIGQRESRQTRVRALLIVSALPPAPSTFSVENPTGPLPCL